MSSFTRRIQKRFLKRANRWEGAEQPYHHRRTHYLALHPTKGWRRVSHRRLAAQHRMARLLGA